MTSKPDAPKTTLGFRLMFPVFVILFVAFVVFFGAKLLEQKTIKDERRAQEERLFQEWVAWRGEHCRLKGSVARGEFVCDNGLSFPSRADRWGEWRDYPDFIREAQRESSKPKLSSAEN